MPNYLRDVLLTLDGPSRRGLRNACRNNVNRDPQNTDPMTPVFFAIYLQVVDLENEEDALLEELWS
jgi:hypothetical protein